MLSPLDDYFRENTVRSFVSKLEDFGFSPVISPYRFWYYAVVAGWKQKVGL